MINDIYFYSPARKKKKYILVATEIVLRIDSVCR